MAKRKNVVYRRLATALAVDTDSLPSIASLEGWRVEAWYGLIVDSESDRYMTNDQMHKRAFAEAAVAKEATTHLTAYKGMWGQKGQMYPLLVLTRDGKTGYVINIDPLTLVQSAQARAKIADAKLRKPRSISKMV